MRRIVLLLAVLAVVVAGTWSDRAQPEPMAAAPPPTTTTTAATVTSTVVDLRPRLDQPGTRDLSEHETRVFETSTETRVYYGPDAAEPILTLDPTTILGTSTVLTVVEGPVQGWAKVMLPVRPNGSFGWVRTEDMTHYVVSGRIVVDLSRRSLTYYQDGEEVLSTAAAVGSSRNPTPIGSFFITDNVTLSDPDSPWGPHAFGLSARSETITEYNGGDGIIGIHGTNKPGSIGNAVSLGCVRVPNQTIAQLHEIVPLGTPVEIQA